MASDHLPGRIEQNVGLNLDDLDLHLETVKILTHRIGIAEEPTKKDVEQLVTHFSRILYPEKTDDRNPYGWILNAVTHNLTDLSYLVTTTKGQKFMDDYVYLHRIAGAMFAHFNQHMGGNVFMVWGGERYINQFPNQHHQAFIQKLINSPKPSELDYGINIHGAKLNPDFRAAAKRYLINLGKVPESLSSRGLAEARQAWANDIPTADGIFLEKISPHGVREGVSPIAKIYRQDTNAVRDSLYQAGKTLANPGMILEMLGDQLEDCDKWYFDTQGTIELINLIRTVSKDHYTQYQQVILTKINQLKKQDHSIPDLLIKSI